jgi:hypothetical protein
MFGGGAQNPPKQNALQQSAAVTHVSPAGVQSPGGTQLPPMHALLQHSAFCVHGFASGTQLGTQVIVPGSQAPLQQSASSTHATPWVWQVSSPKSQRPVSSLQLSEQQWVEPPELQSSPVGRHPGLRSTSHWPSPLHTFEQQSAFSSQFSLSTRHSSPPQVPAWHANEQQSIAFSHGAPSATQ